MKRILLAIRAVLIAGPILACGSAARANLIISASPTSNVSCTAGVCTATARLAVLNAGDLQAMLASSNVVVEPGTLAKNVVVTEPFSWASAHNLSLLASHGSITVNKPVTVAGSGVVHLTYSGPPTALTFGPAGSISFWGTSNSLIIDGIHYQLVSSIADLAALIAVQPTGAFALAKNYDAGPDGTYSAPPLSTFSGAFEGLGNTISNLKISNLNFGGDIGLFGHLTSSGTIHDLRLTKMAIEGGDQKSIAGLVAVNDGELAGDGVSGRVYSLSLNSGSQIFQGELAGTNNGTIESCQGAGRVRANDQSGSKIFVGGLVGMNTRTITSSSATTAIVAVGNSNVLGVYGGGLVGRQNQGTIDGSHATGSLSATRTGAEFGGLIGIIWGGGVSSNTTISNSFATGNVAAKSIGGGLIGEVDADSPHETVTITHSYATGNVSAPADAGGLVGDAYNNFQITLSYAGGNVTAAYAGGLVGLLAGGVSQSFATGAVTSTQEGGGLIGTTFPENTDIVKVTDSYATGPVSGGMHAGGMVGLERGDGFHGTFTTSYSLGAPTGASFNGGFVGNNQAPAGESYSSAYWNTTTSGTTQAIGTGNSAPITGLTTAQLQSGIPAGFDSSVWAESPSVNNGFPYLIANPPP